MTEIKNGTLDGILGSILLIKVIWLLSIFSHFIVKQYYHNKYEKFITEIQYIAHNIFTFLIGLLLIYLYNHLTAAKVCIEGHAKMYLYSFGVLSCIGIIQKGIHRYQFGGNLTMIEKYIYGVDK